MFKRLLKKTTALTLVLALMTSTLSFCLSGCDSKNNISHIYTPTYSDTVLEKFEKTLTDNYDKFEAALSNGNTSEIEKFGATLKKSLESVTTKISEYNNDTQEKITGVDKVIVDRQTEFISNLDTQIKNLSSAIDVVINNVDNPENDEYKENIKIITDSFSQEDILTTSNDFQSNASENKEPKSEYIKSIESFKANSVEAVGTSKPTDKSLLLTDETQLTDEMKSLADKLKTPLNVYQYIKNNVNYECYSGSRKGAIATFESNAGNDVDQASLLIAMLRYLNYPAKYVTGEVVIDADQAVKLTSASDVKNAGTILASSGKPVTALIAGGKTVGFLLEQTWVEAYVPYTDYRGTGNNSGKEMWVALDTSLKEYTKVEGIYDDLERFGLSEEDFKISLNNTDIDEMYNKLTKIEEEHLGEEVVLNTRQIVEESLTYLPLSLQYSVKSIISEYDAVSSEQCDSITFLIDGATIATLKSLDIYSKRLVIEYTPETASDEEIIAEYGSIFDVPAYLVKMVPQLKLDGKVVGKGPAVTLGSSQTFKMNVYSEGKTTSVTNQLTAGSVYQITQDMQNITSAEITKAMNEAKGISESINVDNVYSDAYLGKILDFAGKTYYAQIDIANSFLAEKENISSTRSLSVGMTGYSVKTSRMFNMAVGINEGSLYIDIDLNTMSAVSRSGDEESEYRFVTTSGVISSYYEGLIWEELTGEKGISTISLLNIAQKENQSLLMLSSANFETEKSKLNADSATMQEISNAVNAGKIVTIHSDKLTVDEWQGFGYIITDPKTGGAAYMISGGLSGGSTSGVVTIAYLVNIGFAIADLIQVINMIPAMLSAFAIGGPIGIVAGIVVASIMTALVIAAIYDYYSSIKLMTAYMNGDESAGEELLINSFFNVGFGIGGALLGGVAKRAIKAVAKSKVVKIVGEEIAEKLLKQTSDPTDITKIFKALNKSGVSNDTIKAFIDSSDEAYEWLSKKSSLGLSDELLNKFLTIGDDYLSYSDDLIIAMNKSNGNLDRMISLVSEFGDTAENAFIKSGDYAVNIYDKFGEDALKAVANYGDEAVMLINRHGDDAVKHITKYGNDAIKILDNYGDNGLKALNNGIEPTSIKSLANKKVLPSDYDRLCIANNDSANKILKCEISNDPNIMKNLDLRTCRQEMTSSLEKYSSSMKEIYKSGGAAGICVDASNTGITQHACSGIAQYNPTILDYNNINSNTYSKAADYVAYYRTLLSDEYIDDMPDDFIEGIDIESVKAEMKKLRAAIDNTKKEAKKVNSTTPFPLPDKSPDFSFEPKWSVENCAEVWSARNAILHGAKFDNLMFRTVTNGDTIVKDLCKNCEVTFSKNYIVD